MFYGHITRNLGLAGVSALLFWCKFPCELFGMRACLGVGVIYLYVCGGCGWRAIADEDGGPVLASQNSNIVTLVGQEME